jgi:hypothetical protein
LSINSALLFLRDYKVKELAMAKRTKRTMTSVSMSSTPARTEFNPDYTHVKNDLTRIGTLAGIFFVGLIVLSFFLK